MFDSVNRVIKQSLELGKDLIAKKIPSATGDTVRSLEVKENKLLVRAFFTTLTTGRGPSQKGGKGSTKLLKAIERWAKARGISEEYVPAITRKLHKKGDRVYRGEKKGVDFTEEINKVSENVQINVAKQLEIEIKNIFNN